MMNTEGKVVVLQLYSLKCGSCALLLISQDLRQRTVASMIEVELAHVVFTSIYRLDN